MDDDARVVTASREIDAPADVLFELIADPARQPEWDGNDNLAFSISPRVRAVGDVFVTTLTGGTDRDNHVVELEEPRLIAWRPATAGQPVAGHLWRWELEPLDAARTRVTHTYDWSQLTDPHREERARATTPAMLAASLERLAALAGRA
ncbi:polyketide cyclase [Nocardioides mangrovicus]|uniref:Polyketide cyclase n=1 Tax=Nocardioides mangrovicus TaxID=2478913 RepID=A0A3L8P615_9ACTN|nr:SRPBCC family protein [Nocardioides mangrovicus]RLV49858.1 polyketide cyclase [Nocardioides mangrovicus]